MYLLVNGLKYKMVESMVDCLICVLKHLHTVPSHLNDGWRNWEATTPKPSGL